MPANLLILPLLAGFWFLHFCYYFRFRSQTLDGYRLLIESAFAGAILLVAARILTFGAHFLPGGHALELMWATFAPFDFSGTAAVAFMLGLALPFVVNRWWCSREEAKALAIRRHGNNLLQLLYEAAENKLVVSVTLESRKFYIGWVIDVPNLESNGYLEVVPLLSGYRDKDTLVLRFTTNYAHVYEMKKLQPTDFAVRLPVSKIMVASRFDKNVYPAFLIEEAPAGTGA